MVSDFDIGCTGAIFLEHRISSSRDEKRLSLSTVASGTNTIAHAVPDPLPTVISGTASSTETFNGILRTSMPSNAGDGPCLSCGSAKSSRRKLWNTTSGIPLYDITFVCRQTSAICPQDPADTPRKLVAAGCRLTTFSTSPDPRGPRICCATLQVHDVVAIRIRRVLCERDYWRLDGRNRSAKDVFKSQIHVNLRPKTLTKICHRGLER